MEDTVWYKNINVLFMYDRLSEFFPFSENISIERSLNACVRFSCYFTAIVLACKADAKPMQVLLFPVIVIVFTFFYYENLEKKPVRSTKSMKEHTQSEVRVETVDKSRSVDNEPERQSRVQMQPTEGIQKLAKVSVERCERRPTINNPFMNVLVSDYDTSIGKPLNVTSRACDTENPKVKDDMQIGFEDNLFRDVSDIFGKNASDRQYYTTPSSQIVNDQTGFAKWLYD